MRLFVLLAMLSFCSAAPAQTVMSGTDLPPGDAAPPPVEHDRAADRHYGAQAMADAEHMMMAAHGGGTYNKLMIDRAEYRVRDGRDGYAWEGEAWIGGDLDRLVLKSQGEGAAGGKAESIEGQALYSRALDPWWNLQVGVRHDFQPGPQRTYATVGVEGLAPLMFDLQAAAFLSDKGDLLARIEGTYDLRLTQRLIAQPRGELNFAAQDVPELGTRAGLSSSELGLRLRYEVRPEFAPYAGVEWTLLPDARNERAFVFGVRAWF